MAVYILHVHLRWDLGDESARGVRVEVTRPTQIGQINRATKSAKKSRGVSYVHVTDPRKTMEFTPRSDAVLPGMQRVSAIS